MKKKRFSIKLRTISIKNYKGIDSFSIDFPMPTLSDDPDIMVMGSENGLGKTSIIECCALLLMSLKVSEKSFQLRDRYLSIDIPDLLIRAGKDYAEISGDIVVNDQNLRVKLHINKHGVVKTSSDGPDIDFLEDNSIDTESGVDELIKAICGFSPNPVIENLFLLFHSYRKVQEGNPELGMMVRGIRSIHRMPSYRRMELPLSEFKLIILRSLMNKADLFEFSAKNEPENTIDKLNELVKLYAGGTISKLRPSAENTVDFRITPVDGGESVTFDGLSSGQKEIISTLFLIWYHTNNNPLVVFIDEPELHLNAQWHRSFVNSLIKLAPKNQYIIATHSEGIMDSVYKDRRVLLLNEKENGND